VNDQAAILQRLSKALPQGSQLSLESRFDQIGVDSIDLVELLVVVDAEYGVRITQDDFAELVTLGDLTRLVLQRRKG